MIDFNYLEFIDFKYLASKENWNLIIHLLFLEYQISLLHLKFNYLLISQMIYLLNL